MAKRSAKKSAPAAPAALDEVQHEVVDKSVFLAARLRQTLIDNEALCGAVTNLQAELARLRSAQVKADIADLETEFKIVVGETISARPDGTYWRVPQ